MFRSLGAPSEHVKDGREHSSGGADAATALKDERPAALSYTVTEPADIAPDKKRRAEELMDQLRSLGYELQAVQAELGKAVQEEGAAW